MNEKRTLAGIYCFVALIFAFRIYSLLLLTDSTVVFSYPFIWPDSFDWITNAVYYREYFAAGSSPIDPTIRQPLLPLLINFALSLDWLASIVVIIQLCTFLTIVFVERTLAIAGTRLWLRITTVFILTLHHSFNRFSFYFMADPICIFLQVLAVYFYARYIFSNFKLRRQLLLGALLAGTASIAQFYGLFPALVLFPFLLCLSLFKRQSRIFVDAILQLAIVCLFQGGWMVFKKFQFGSFTATKVTQFENLIFSFQNLEFYGNVWTIFFLPALCVMICAIPYYRIPQFKFPHIFFISFLACLSALFLTSTFFFLWQESRYTTYGLPFFYCGVILFLDYCTRTQQSALISAFVIACSSYLAIIPTDNLMKPKLALYLQTAKTPSLVLSENIYATLSTIDPGNRYTEQRECLSKFGEEKFPNGCDHYIYRNIRHILRYFKIDPAQFYKST